jgi:hypothetical protein
MRRFSKVEGGIDLSSNPGKSVKRSAKAMHIRVLSFSAALVASLCDSLPGRLITAIEFRFLQQFLARRKELGLFAFFKEFLVLFGAVSQKHAAAGGDFEATRGVLVWAGLA